jgi:hypothetical protein
MNSRGSEIINGAIKSYTGAIAVQFERGTVTGTTITFKHKFVEVPEVLLTPWAAAGGASCSGISLNQDVDGFYISATIETTGCDFVTWHATGMGIVA